MGIIWVKSAPSSFNKGLSFQGARVLRWHKNAFRACPSKCPSKNDENAYGLAALNKQWRNSWGSRILMFVSIAFRDVPTFRVENQHHKHTWFWTSKTITYILSPVFDPPVMELELSTFGLRNPKAHGATDGDHAPNWPDTGPLPPTHWRPSGPNVEAHGLEPQPVEGAESWRDRTFVSH